MNNFFQSLKFKNHYQLIIVLFVFGLIFCSISLVNHYNFRTFGWDLGIYNNIIYDYAHFRWNDCILMLPNHQFENILSDHFNLLHFFFSPLYWVLGTYTMLIVQIAGILFGGLGIYNFIKNLTNNKKLAILATIHFFSIWGIYSALGFDYHDNVLAAMFVPCFINYIHLEKWWKATIFFILILISKENMALWAFFIGLGLICLYYKDTKKIKYLTAYTFFSIIYFFIVVKLIIPSLAIEGKEYLHFNFHALGDNFSGAIKTIYTKPIYVFGLLFKNHLNDPVYNGIKAELHYITLLSGGIILIFRPQYLIMLLPIFAQKLFNDDYQKWGLNLQYSIEFVPILTIAVFSWIHKLNNNKRKIILGYIFVIVCIITTFSTLNSRVSKWYNPEFIRFYKKEHYIRDFNVKELHKILKLIPDNAIVSAQSMIVPHLAFRDYIYHYPYVQNAEYIVLLTADESKYPLTKDEYNNKISEYKHSPDWDIFYENEYALIFKRK